MAYQCSTQTASNCQSKHVFSLLNHPVSFVRKFCMSSYRSLFYKNVLSINRIFLNKKSSSDQATFYDEVNLSFTQKNSTETSSYKSIYNYHQKSSTHKSSSSESTSEHSNKTIHRTLSYGKFSKLTKFKNLIQLTLINFLFLILNFKFITRFRIEETDLNNCLKKCSKNSSKINSINLRVLKNYVLINLIKHRSNLLSILSNDNRSFFLWPFILKLVSKIAKLSSGLVKNGSIQFFILFILSAIPVSANLKVSVQGDILLGGIFPVHQKGRFLFSKSSLVLKFLI